MPPGLVIVTWPASGAGVCWRPALAGEEPAAGATTRSVLAAPATPSGDCTLVVMVAGTVSAPLTGRFREESPTRIW